MRFWRHKHPPEPSRESAVDDPAAVIMMMVEEARARIDRQFSNNASHDVKAAAVLAGSGVIAPLVIAFRQDYGPSWPVPVVASITVAAVAWATLLSRKYNPGPHLREFYGKHGGRDPLDAGQRLFSELLRANEDNACPLEVKAALSKVALIGFVLIGPVSALFWLLWR
jgi:hypothetical protein